MDYEKLYKEANKKVAIRFGSNVAKELFPDLYESKDERIKNGLFRLLNCIAMKEYDIFCITKEEALAWVEKQGKKETDEWKEGNIIRRGGILALVIKGRRAMKSNGEIFTVQYPDEWVKAVPNEIEHFLNELEKQDEQEPVNRLKTTAGNWYVCDMEVMNENMTTAFHRGEVYYCPKDGYIDVYGALFEVGTLDVFRLATKEEIPQQKQEWSEEDEENIQMVIDWLKRYLSCHIQTQEARNDINGIINWLKFLKDRVSPQPKQEWNEEDKKMLEELLNYCDTSIQYNGIESPQAIKWKKRKDWLKSLKDRYTWKPSDEHMVVLNDIIINGHLSNANERILKGLQEQLKKL